jgi:mono/diheme cytochrome c family protein
MVIRAIRNIVVFWVLWGVFVGSSAAQEQGKREPIAPAKAPSGAELYMQHCAACHGADLRGSGPFPPPYRVPPDLTTLARRHSGKFPDVYVSNVLRNGVKLPAHGPAEMPVWGAEFEATEQLNKAQVTLRVKSLTNYIKSLQLK